MKKLIFVLAIMLAFISCQEKAPAPAEPEVVEVDPNIVKFNNNVETAKSYIAAFCANDSTKMFSYVTEDFMWSPPSVGQDSLPRATWEESMKGFMAGYNNKELTNPLFFAGLDENQKPNGDVRAYGLWKFNFAESGAEGRVKWYAVMFFNEEGKITHEAEWFDTADLTKEYTGE